MSLGDVEVKIQTLVTGDAEGDVSAAAPSPFTERSVKTISTVVNQVVKTLKEQIDLGDADDKLTLGEVSVNFGMDFEFETGIPIIGPIFGARAKSGATFQVNITLKQKEQPHE